jgi:OmpA-OmpF porin, OOP family
MPSALVHLLFIDKRGIGMSISILSVVQGKVRPARNRWAAVVAAAKSLARVLCLGLAGFGAPAAAQSGPFASGWTLNTDSSSLAFQSVKNQTKVESSTFAIYSGKIDESGTATIQVQLDSVDTKVDLRNVRMRFLFFETFKFPAATVTVKIDPALVADLPEKRRKVLTLPFTLDLHGLQKEMTAQVAVVLISPDLVTVSTVAPISIAVDDFGLTPGLDKLQEAANVQIIPSGSVTFDFLFARNTSGAGGTETADAGKTGAGAALETQGAFSRDECVGRFEILSQSRSIYFAKASARLDAESNAFLDALYDIVRRCPDLVIEIGGHTDSVGSDASNQRLSEHRAQAVEDYLAAKGIPRDRLLVKGYGETAPVASNDTEDGKAKNRRIEFKVIG